MIIIAYYTENGAPKTGLNPAIDIVEVATDTLVVNDGAMTALTNMTHAYYYDFTAYDDEKDYAMTIDGGAALSNNDRYKYASNENQGLEFVYNVESGRWIIDEDNNQMVFYKSDNSTVVAIFNLKDINGNAASRNIFERTRV